MVENTYYTSVLTANSLKEAIACYKIDSDPSSTFTIGDWNNSDCWKNARNLYRCNLDKCVKDFNGLKKDIWHTEHVSMLGVTHIYRTENEKQFKFVLEVFDVMFVSGAQSLAENRMYYDLELNDHNVENPFTEEDFGHIVAFPTNDKRRSHSDRGVASFLTNFGVKTLKGLNPMCCFIHLVSIVIVCTPCYGMLKSKHVKGIVKDRDGKDKMCFLDGKGLVDTFIDGRNVAESVEEKDMPRDVMNIPVFIGASHYQDYGGSVVVDWMSR